MNRLSINIDKTKVMSVHSRHIDIQHVPSIEVAGKNLQHVTKYEYPGIVMDDKLNMNNHVGHITKKVQGKLCVLRKIRRHNNGRSSIENCTKFIVMSF